MDDLNDMEAEFEIKALQKKIAEQKSEIDRLMQVIKDNDLMDEIGEVTQMSDAEYICIKGLEHLRKLYETGIFSKDETQQVKILAEVLMNVRRGSSDKLSGKKSIKTNDVGKLLDIVKGQDQ